MNRGTGDRGVSEVIGFILVFGMLVTAFTVYQGIVVPDQNRQVEFEHNQQVQGQIQDLRNAILSTSATGSGQAVSVTLGATYPKRTIAQNLGVSGGALQTVGSNNIRIANAKALDTETAHYLDGSERAFETKSIRYTPVYSFYSEAPDTFYENSLAFNRFDDANLTITDQVVVDGRRITLVAVNGSLSRTQRETVSVSTEAISTSSNRVAVRNRTGERINITIPTRLSATKWEEILADEIGGAGEVESVSDVVGEDAVILTMEQGVTYELRMAKIGVGDVTTEERAKYITSVEGDGSNVPEGGTQQVTIEVRDRFNNPVSNVTVTPNVSRVSPNPQVTDANGRATFTYSAPDTGPIQDEFEISFDGDGTVNESVTFAMQVLDTDGSASGGGGGGDDGGDTQDINPGASGTITLESTSTVGGGGSTDVTFTLSNRTSASSPVEAVGARISFYFKGGNEPDPSYGDLELGTSSSGTTRLSIYDDFDALNSPIELEPSDTQFRMTFDQKVEFEDFYVLSIRFKMPGGETDTYTYFISHPM